MKQRQVQLLGVLHRLLAGRAGAHQAAADGALNDALRAGIADPLSWAPSLGPNLGFVRSKVGHNREESFQTCHACSLWPRFKYLSLPAALHDLYQSCLLVLDLAVMMHGHPSCRRRMQAQARRQQVTSRGVQLMKRLQPLCWLAAS